MKWLLLIPWSFIIESDSDHKFHEKKKNHLSIFKWDCTKFIVFSFSRRLKSITILCVYHWCSGKRVGLNYVNYFTFFNLQICTRNHGFCTLWHLSPMETKCDGWFFFSMIFLFFLCFQRACTEERVVVGRDLRRD